MNSPSCLSLPNVRISVPLFPALLMPFPWLCVGLCSHTHWKVLLVLTVCVPPGLRVDESSAPAGDGGAAEEEMLHAAVLPRPQFRCEPARPACSCAHSSLASQPFQFDVGVRQVLPCIPHSLARNSLCHPSWSQTCSKSASSPRGWDYWHDPPCPV